jgi:hypothetical protein
MWSRWALSQLGVYGPLNSPHSKKGIGTNNIVASAPRQVAASSKKHLSTCPPRRRTTRCCGWPARHARSTGSRIPTRASVSSLQADSSSSSSRSRCLCHKQLASARKHLRLQGQSHLPVRLRGCHHDRQRCLLSLVRPSPHRQSARPVWRVPSYVRSRATTSGRACFSNHRGSLLWWWIRSAVG